MMISSLTLKSPAIVNALEAAEKRGCKIRILLEREIASRLSWLVSEMAIVFCAGSSVLASFILRSGTQGWKAWYAGPSALDHLLANQKELRDRRCSSAV